MSNFTFKSPSGETFKVTMPPGATLEQAQAIFKQQVDSGGLTGFKSGDVLSAVTQASDGMAAAAAQAQQGIGSALGKLSSNINLKTITDTIGVNGFGAGSQTTAAEIGTSSNLPAVFGGSTALLSPLTGSDIPAGSTGNQLINGITKAFASAPTNGIDISNFVKQGPSLAPIGDLSKADVSGLLAQTNKLVGQTAEQLSNSQGLGKFGFDATQLERSGYIKPGTSAEFLSSGSGDLVSVLQSPLPWTGKDGVNGLNNLLGNSKLQDKIQQDLMATGLNDLKQVGLPIDKLTPPALGGIATLAAKGAGDALAWVKGSQGMSGDLKAKLDAVVSNSAFAVKLTQDKIDPALKQEDPAPAATNTVNADTVNAAGKRIVGNDKVPDVIGLGSNSTAGAIITDYANLVSQATAGIDSLIATVLVGLTQQFQISQFNWNTANQELQIIQSTFNSRNADLAEASKNAIESLSPSDPDYARINEIYNEIPTLIAALNAQIEKAKQLIQNLANKITTQSA